jgi:hypothetical protein
VAADFSAQRRTLSDLMGWNVWSEGQFGPELIQALDQRIAQCIAALDGIAIDGDRTRDLAVFLRSAR